MIISKEQKEALKKLLPLETDRLLQSDNAMDVLDALDNLYPDLLDEEQEPTDASRECERLRDHIHWNNFHKE